MNLYPTNIFFALGFILFIIRFNMIFLLGNFI